MAVELDLASGSGEPSSRPRGWVLSGQGTGVEELGGLPHGSPFLPCPAGCVAPILHRHEPGLPDGHLVLLRQPPAVLQVGPGGHGHGHEWGAGSHVL